MAGVGVVRELKAEYLSRAALARTIQLAGAAQRALDLSVRYASERVQFGRPIGRFQAVQQQLAELAGETALLDVGARAAVAQWTGAIPANAITAARVAADRSAGTVAAIAHQIHGAIGVTGEHELHRVTLRLNSWREEHRAELITEDPWRFVVDE